MDAELQGLLKLKKRAYLLQAGKKEMGCSNFS